MQKYWNTVTQRSGAVVQGASVSVMTYPGGAAATIYSDDGVTPVANPLTTDANGYFEFYAADGRYSLIVTGAGLLPYTITDVALLEDPTDDKAAIAALQLDVATKASSASVALKVAIADLASTASGKGAALVGFAQPGGTSRTVLGKLREVVSVKDFGAEGDGIVDDGPAIRAAYAVSRNIRWPEGKYRLKFDGMETAQQYIQVYADTETQFDRGVVIQKDTSVGVIFCNAPNGDTTITGYDGAGNIRFSGPAVFELYGGAMDAYLQPYAFVHARGIVIKGGGTVRNWTGRHAIEFNACADWRVSDYTFENQGATAGDEALSEVIQWDGAFNGSQFPFAPGASDQTTCQDFEISGCTFRNVYTAYGAHHTDFGGAKHRRAKILNNTIIDAQSDGEHLRHLQDSVAYGQVIERTQGRGTNPRECIDLVQDGYSITDGGRSGTSVVFWQTSENCVWGPGSRIRYSGAGTRYTAPYEVGSVTNPSVNTLIYEGLVDSGSSANNPILGDNGTNTRFIGGQSSNTRSRPTTWGDFHPALNIDSVAAGGYILLAKVSDPSHVVSGTFRARQAWDVGSGSQHVEVSINTVSGADGVRRTVWNQRYVVVTNNVTVETVTWGGEQWVAIKTNATADRAFGRGATFTGFATTSENQFRAVPASEVSGASLITTGRHVIVGELAVQSGNVFPLTDNTHSVGTASLRWSVVYAGTGAISTSDATEKQEVRELSDAERRVAVRLKGLIRAFKFNDAVQAKGDGARIHVGVIAQDVQAAFEAEGLDPFDYALLCYDEWDEQQEDRDEDGNVVQEYRPAGNRYGVRYEELLAFILGVL